jgi:hypothetical protein
MTLDPAPVHRRAAVRIALCAAFAAAVAAMVAVSSRSIAPPVGPLPPSPVTTITTVTDELVSFALPRGRSGLVWRTALDSNQAVAREFAEGDIPGNITVIVFIARKPGTTNIAFGLTNDERPKAYRAARYRLIVKPRPAGR